MELLSQFLKLRRRRYSPHLELTLGVLALEDDMGVTSRSLERVDNPSSDSVGAIEMESLVWACVQMRAVPYTLRSSGFHGNSKALVQVTRSCHPTSLRLHRMESTLAQR